MVRSNPAKADSSAKRPRPGIWVVACTTTTDRRTAAERGAGAGAGTGAGADGCDFNIVIKEVYGAWEVHSFNVSISCTVE